MALSQITARQTGQMSTATETIEATGCDRGTTFAAALLRAGRSRRQRGVGADVATDTSARCPMS